MSAPSQSLSLPPTHSHQGTLRARFEMSRAPGAHPLDAESAFRAFLEAVGVDTADPHLRDTPARVARAYRELFAGLDEATRPRLTTFPNLEGTTALIVMRGIAFHSMCAHHLLPFFGEAHIGYVPGERLVGLSKLARVLEYHARRPQVQERMTEAVASLLTDEIGAAGVAVYCEARHMCMEMRGVAKRGAVTSTLAVRGVLAERNLQRQFLDRVHRSRACEED